MPVKGKLFIEKLLHGHHLYSHPGQAQDPQSMLLLQVQLSHGSSVLRKQLLKGGLRARFSSSFSLERAMARMQPRLERLSHLWGESKQRARRRLRELVRSEACADELNLAPQQAPGPPAGPASSALSGPSITPGLQHMPAGPASTLVVHGEDAVFGHDGLLRQVLLKSVASLSSAFMQRWNTTEIMGSEHMEAALKRPRGQGLVTVCNHVAAMDDPLVMSTLVPSHFFDQPSSLRWTLCATDRCFKYAGLSQLFTAMKVLPVQRGAGMKQPGLAAAESRVASGDWVHLFPEGTRSRTPSRMGPIRKGVGRLVAAAAEQAALQGGQPPLVVPFVHAGMEEVMPVGRLLPCTGQTVRVVVGKPIAMDDLLEAAKTDAWSEDMLYTAIANRIQSRMHAMHAALHTREAEVELEGEQPSAGLWEPQALLPSLATPSPLSWSPGATNPGALSRAGVPSPEPPYAWGLLGASLFRLAELTDGYLPASRPGLHCSSSPGSGSCSGSGSCNDRCLSGNETENSWASEVEQSVAGSSISSSSSSSSNRPAGCEALVGSGSRPAQQDSRASRAQLALAWMRTLQQGDRAPGGLCERLFYGFSLNLRPPVALGL